MQTPRIVAIGTAVPARRFSQEELADLFGYGDGLQRSFFHNSGIDGRHLYITAAEPRQRDDRRAVGPLRGGQRAPGRGGRRDLSRPGRAGRGRRRLPRDDDLHRTARPEPRRAPDRGAGSPERRAARARRGHGLRQRDGRPPAGVELSPRLSGAPRARRVGRAVLDHLLPGRRGGDRGGERDLRGRRGRGPAQHDGRRAGDPRSPDADPSGVPGSHGIHLPRRLLPHPPVARSAADRAGDDGRADRHTPEGSRAHEGGRALLGAPLRGPAGDRERAGPAGARPTPTSPTPGTFCAGTGISRPPPCSSSSRRFSGAAVRGRATSASWWRSDPASPPRARCSASRRPCWPRCPARSRAAS